MRLLLCLLVFTVFNGFQYANGYAQQRRSLLDVSPITKGIEVSELPTSKKDFVVSIKGKAIGAEGRYIKWSVKEDPISDKDFIVDDCLIDTNGEFELRGIFWQIMPTTLKIDYYDALLFVSPGTDYEINFYTFDYKLDEKINVFFPSAQIPSLTYSISNPENEELNSSIWRFLSLYSHYITPQSYEQILIYSKKDSLYSFINYIDSIGENLYPLLSDHEREYVNIYVKYTMANLEDFAKLKSGKALYNNYIKEAPIYYRNPAQMDFIFSYFDSYFETKTPIPQKALQRVFASANAAAVLDTMGVDSLLVNQQLRELVFLFSASKAVALGKYDVKSLLTIIGTVGKDTKFSAHKVLAGNILERERIRLSGYRNFSGIIWKNDKGMEVKIDTVLSGLDFGYICFVKRSPLLSPGGSVEVESLRLAFQESKVLREKGKILVLICDDDISSFYEYAKSYRNEIAKDDSKELEKDQYIDYYYFNKNIDALKAWEVYSFPSFAIIDNKNRLYPNALPPTKGGIKKLLNTIK